MDDLWYKDAIFYEVYVRAFCDSNGDGHGDLRGLTRKLDYLQDLGVDCLWLLPICASPLVDDGYDVSDYYSILQAYGTVNDFRQLVASAHARDMRVITDLVMNHTSDQHPWFAAARAAKDSPKRDWYIWSRTDQKFREARIIFVDSQQSNWEFDARSGEYYFHRFYPQQPDLNYDNPAVQQTMLDIIKYWLALGIDGFRCDAVPYLFKREGTNCENLPETHAYLKRVRRFVDENYSGRLLLAEANQWPRDARAYFGDGDEFHMAFHFPLMPRLFMALKCEARTPIVTLLNQTPPIPAACQWCTFLRNHDELTLEMVTAEEREWMWRAYAPEPRMRLNLGIRRRLAPLLDNDRRKIELAHALLFTLPGSPIIYYGDEIGMGDNIWLDDRDGVRTPMQWSSDKNAGFSTAAPAQLYLPVIDDPVFGYIHVNVAAQRVDSHSLWNTIRRMIATRKAKRVFGRGHCQFIETENSAALVYTRQYGDELVLSVNNLSTQSQQVTLELSAFNGGIPVNLLTGRSFPAVTRAPYILVLNPHEYLWLEIRKDESKTNDANHPAPNSHRSNG